MLNIITLTLPPFQTNTYIIFEKLKGKCIVIDPASSFSVIKDKIDEFKLKPAMIFLTHGHFDHIGACDELRNEYNIPLAIHENDAEMITSPKLNASALLTSTIIALNPADKILKNSDVIKLESESLKVMHTPGHTQGSCVLIGRNVVFSGDTLFSGGYGRYDLFGGSFDELVNSLEKIFTLDESLKVYPGHGPTTDIFNEKTTLKIY